MTGLFDNATVWLSLRFAPTLAYRLWIIGAEEDCRHYVAGESLTVHTELAFFLSSWRLLTVCFLSVCLPGRESTLCCPEALLSLLDNGEGAPSWISSPLIAAPLLFFFPLCPWPTCTGSYTHTAGFSLNLLHDSVDNMKQNRYYIDFGL